MSTLPAPAILQVCRHHSRRSAAQDPPRESIELASSHAASPAVSEGTGEGDPMGRPEPEHPGGPSASSAHSAQIEVSGPRRGRRSPFWLHECRHGRGVLSHEGEGQRRCRRDAPPGGDVRLGRRRRDAVSVMSSSGWFRCLTASRVGSTRAKLGPEQNCRRREPTKCEPGSAVSHVSLRKQCCQVLSYRPSLSVRGLRTRQRGRTTLRGGNFLRRVAKHRGAPLASGLADRGSSSCGTSCFSLSGGR